MFYCEFIKCTAMLVNNRLDKIKRTFDVIVRYIVT